MPSLWFEPSGVERMKQNQQLITVRNWVCFEHWFIAELIEHGMLQQEPQFFKLFVHLDSRADSAAQLSLIGIFWFFISQRNLHINNFRKFECWEKPWIASSAPWITRTWNLRKNRELQIRELRNRELRGSPVFLFPFPAGVQKMWTYYYTQLWT